MDDQTQGSGVETKAWAVVLAGGKGVRLRELTRHVYGEDRPKQYAALTGGKSLLRQTLDRVSLRIPSDRTVVVTMAAQGSYLAKELRQESPGPHVLRQPEDRGTAAAVLLAAHWIRARDSEARLVVLPSDHFVADDTIFMEHVVEVVNALEAQPERIILLGAITHALHPSAGQGIALSSSELNPRAYADHHKGVRYIARLLCNLVLIAALTGLAACDRSPKVNAAPKPPAVTVVAVAQRSVPIYGQYVGQTEAVKTVEVRARVEGFIERQVAPDGANVRAGDLLFTIDPRPLEAALRQAEANVARDTAALRQAESAVNQREADVRQTQANVDRDVAQVENARTQEVRYRTLFEKQLIAKEQYDQIRTNMVALEATVQADHAALENARAALAASRAAIENARAAVRADEAVADSARLQLGYTSIRSPLDGRMGRAEVRVGAFVGKGDATLLATVSTLDPMYVSFSVSEREALSVWNRRQAEMRAKPSASGITITLSDDSPYAHDGRLDFVDRAVDPRTGTLALRAAFPNPAGLLQPGQYVRVRVLLSERSDALLVPQAAIQESQGSTSLFVVAPDQTVQVRSVRMGPRVGPLWVVEEGVKLGERVVIKGLQQIRPGIRVEPTLEALPAATGG